MLVICASDSFGEFARLCRTTEKGDLPDLASVGHLCRSFRGDVTVIRVAG